MVIKTSLRLHPRDSVAVALVPLQKGTHLEVDGIAVEARDDIPRGHKIALRSHAPGEPVFKYGHRIGVAAAAIAPGSWVHSHNLRTAIQGTGEYAYHPVPGADPRLPASGTFEGYRRENGRVGTRNEIWILPTVGCVNTSAARIAGAWSVRPLPPGVDGVFSFPHPYGCSQLGDDLDNTRRILRGLLRHPNAGGVVLLSLGCENNQPRELLEGMDVQTLARVRTVRAQGVEDEVEEGHRLVGELLTLAGANRRTTCSLDSLVLGMKCGGSDALSGVTANPLVGRVTDAVTAAGGTVLLTEVPEMFGAEEHLMERAADRATFERIVGMINGFKEYFQRHGQPVYENPSPGNKEGGITTLEEKSLGAIQKGGQATVRGVLAYGEEAHTGGLLLVNAPGNDGVSSTALIAAGATLLLFTTGRGTPLGFPVPTVKIATNTELALRKPAWIDVNAGSILEGAADWGTMTETLLGTVRAIASGAARARNEIHGYREITIWKDGVTL
jgi:altronate hydrolase